VSGRKARRRAKPSSAQLSKVFTSTFSVLAFSSQKSLLLLLAFWPSALKSLYFYFSRFVLERSGRGPALSPPSRAPARQQEPQRAPRRRLARGWFASGQYGRRAPSRPAGAGGARRRVRSVRAARAVASGQYGRRAPSRPAGAGAEARRVRGAPGSAAPSGPAVPPMSPAWDSAAPSAESPVRYARSKTCAQWCRGELGAARWAEATWPGEIERF